MTIIGITRLRKGCIAFSVILILLGSAGKRSMAQTPATVSPATSGGGGSAYPDPLLDQSLIPPSPNAAGFTRYGIIPVSLYNGMPHVVIPIFTVRQGGLSLPITLSYNYNGLRPREDAGWAGLGWSLEAGGVITRMIQGQVDGSRAAGYNYDEYNLEDSLDEQNNFNFLQAANDQYAYDLGADIFFYNFNGHSGKFIWYKGKAYCFPYDKASIYKAPNDSYIRIISEDGTVYNFQATETTTTKQVSPNDPYIAPYISSWHLTQVISANKKDTISLGYSTGYTWREYAAAYNQTYQQFISGTGPCTPTTGLTSNHAISPSVNAVALQSIDCDNVHVDFVAGSRTDIDGTYPSLQEIDVYDKNTSNILKHCVFSYEYFGAGQTYSNYERLKLKQYTESAPAGGLDTGITENHTYTFKYINEYGQFPSKGTIGIDHWGFYNGKDGQPSLFPASTGISLYGDRDPSFNFCSYGALDTVVYPTGGYTTFQYGLNQYEQGIGDKIPGPGIRVETIHSFAYNADTPVLTRHFSYLLDSVNTASGFLFNPPEYTPYSYEDEYQDPTTGSLCDEKYYIFQTPSNGSFGGIYNDRFYYQKVTETDSSGSQVHKSDYYFNSFTYLFTGVDLIKKVEYRYDPSTKTFTPAGMQVFNYSFLGDTSFQSAVTWLTGTYSGIGNTNPESFGFSNPSISSGWKFPVSTFETVYDRSGNSATTATYYYFNPITRNLTSTVTNTSDGRSIEHEFKYPEDYISSITGNMVAAHVLSPVIEEQTWLKSGATDSSLISGKIMAYDQNLFKPAEEYLFQDTVPINTLSNNRQSNGLYTSLISDSHYADRLHFDYDSYGNLEEQDKIGSESNSDIWGYDHAYPIAEVKNATENQIAYTSFETPDKGNWNYSGPASAGGKTGNYQYNLSGGSITSNTLPTGLYVISYWSNNGGVTVSGGTVTNSVNGESDGTAWKYYEYTVALSSPGIITISGSVNIDELRLYPAGAEMTTFTYAPSVGITSQCSPGNKILYYQYDGFNRLRTITDQQGNIIKTINYNYKK